MKKFLIAILGNPNCGKTTLFNALTGATQTVGNWPGVTVEKKSGVYAYEGMSFEVVDLPGIYSFSATSLDEEIARDFVLYSKPDLIVNIVDASSLERNLYLTSQLIEMKVPVVLVLNMMDEARRKRIVVDDKALSGFMDCPVVLTSAHRGIGVEELKQKIQAQCAERRISQAKVHYPQEVEQVIEQVATIFGGCCKASRYDARWLAVKHIEGDFFLKACGVEARLVEFLPQARAEVHKILGEEADIVIADSRYGFVNAVCKKVQDRTNILKKDISDTIDRFALNRFLGVPFFLLIMYLAFWVTINLGGCFIDFFDIASGAIFVDLPRQLLTQAHVPIFWARLLAEGIGGGIQTVATFIPPIFFMFLCLALLEDSGYMSRAAFIMDRFMRMLGLPGKAFLPLLMGFGCNVPAILATRTLENSRDRILTIMMNPLMSCGARFPVYALFAVAFFPGNGSAVIFALYLIGVAVAILTAFLLRKTLFPGESSPFILELPPYHVPTMRGVLLHTWQRLKEFVLRAGQAIMIVVIILTALNTVTFSGKLAEHAGDSALAQVGKVIVPVFEPMGMTEANWPAAVSVITGVLFKEAVIATLNSLYAQIDLVKEASFDLMISLKAALESVWTNVQALSPPFSIPWISGESLTADIGDHGVNASTYDALRTRFDGQVGAFAYLLLVLLYMPCISAIAAVYQELNFRWAIFSATYLSVIAWALATIFYQTLRFSKDPVGAGMRIALAIVLIGAVAVFLKVWGRRWFKV